MKPEIIMCNYYGMCDSEGEPIGHTVKVTNEYSDLLKEKYAVTLAASPCIVRKAESSHFKKIQKLKYDICVSGNGIVKRIYDKVKLLSNIHQIVKGKNIYFFYQVDFFFFFYMCFFYKVNKNRKIVCLIYHQDFTGGKLAGILQTIYRIALKKIDGVIYTQDGNPIQHPNTIWIPDFFYSEEQYKKYQCLNKKKQAVCLGTMNRYKQLEELVKVFAKVDMPLIIAGRFDDKDRFHKLVEGKTENVEIRDEILSYEEYMELMATSQYSILPYDMGQYINRTSGVLLESIYVGSIPVAPDKLLSQNNLPGIGYIVLQDLLDKAKWNESVNSSFKEIYMNNNTSKFIEFMDCFIKGWLNGEGK